MEIQRIALKDLIRNIEEQCTKKYPNILEDIQLCIIKIKILIPEIIEQVRVLASLATDQTAVDTTIKKYAKLFYDLDSREIYYIDKKSIINFLDSSKMLAQTRLFFHTAEHIQFKSQWEANQSLKLIKNGINTLLQIFDDVKIKLHKNAQVYIYFNEMIEFISQKVKMFSEEITSVLSQKDFESYCHQFNSLYDIYKKSMDHMACKDYVVYLHLKKEIKLLVQKLKIILEYPKELALHYHIRQQEFDQSQSMSLTKVSNFKTIVSYLKGTNFVETYLLAFGIEEIIETIRMLHNNETEKDDIEYQEPVTRIYYDEQVFLDLAAKYINLLAKMSTIKSEGLKIKWKSRKDVHPAEMANLMEIGERIYDFSIKMFKYSLFVKKFNGFRQKMQEYFYDEFDQVIDLYY